MHKNCYSPDWVQVIMSCAPPACSVPHIPPFPAAVTFSPVQGAVASSEQQCLRNHQLIQQKLNILRIIFKPKIPILHEQNGRGGCCTYFSNVGTPRHYPPYLHRGSSPLKGQLTTLARLLQCNSSEKTPISDVLMDIAFVNLPVKLWFPKTCLIGWMLAMS